MPGACVSLWPTEQCEWSTWDIWRSSDLVERAIYISFGLMVVYTLVVLIRFILGSISTCRDSRESESESGLDFQRQRIATISGLIRGLGTLRGIGIAAPFPRTGWDQLWNLGGVFIRRYRTK